MNIIFFSFSLLIISNLCNVNCIFNNNNLNNNKNDDPDDKVIIQGKKLFFESYKYYNNNTLFNSPRNKNSSYTLAKYDKNTDEYTPFPNEHFIYQDTTSKCGENFISIVSMEVDDEDYLYLLDEGSEQCPAKLYKMKIKGNKIEEKKIYNTTKILNTKDKILNDFVIDKINNYAYIIYYDGEGEENSKQTFKIIVIDLEKNEISKWKSVQIDFDENYLIDSELNQSYSKIFSHFQKKLVRISLSCDGESLFFSPFASRKIYSISTKDLREKDNVEKINEAYKNDATMSLISSNLGNLFFWGIEQKAIFLVGQIDNDLSRFDYRGFNKIEIKKNVSFISKISLEDGKLLLTYNNYVNESFSKREFFEKEIDEDNTYEKSYVYRCTGLIYKYDWKSIFVWIIFAIIVFFIIIFVLVENKQDFDNNNKKTN